MIKNVFLYITKFVVIFCILYFVSIAVIGLSFPDGYYSPFIAHYLNYVDWLRASLLWGAKGLLALFSYKTYLPDKYHLLMKNGSGVNMVYSCIGYGVMSFWGALIIANKGSWKKKLLWITGGWLAIWCINVARIAILVVAVNKRWQMPLGLDHHTWVNIVAYLLIFILIYFYDKSSQKISTKTISTKHS